MTGAQRRTRTPPFSTMAATTTRVVSALRGPATAGVSGGTFSSCSKMTGITVTGVSMMTVPVTVGVRIRRKSASRAENASWKRARATTRVASRAGPAGVEGGDADRDGRPGRSGREEVARTDPPES